MEKADQNFPILSILEKNVNNNKLNKLEFPLMDRSLDFWLEDFFRRSQREDPEFARILTQFEGMPAQDLPEEPAIPEVKKVFHSPKHGLSAHAFTAANETTQISINGKGILQDGDEYTEVHFTPGNRIRFNRSNMTDSIDKGIKGLVDLVAAIEKGDVDLPPVFIGDTNLNMALASQRLGFKIADSCLNPDGTINRKRNKFVVVGRFEDIRQKLTEFIQKGLDKKIAERAARGVAKRMGHQLQPA